MVMAMAALKSLWASSCAPTGAGSAPALVEATVMGAKRSPDDGMTILPECLLPHIDGNGIGHTSAFPVRRQDRAHRLCPLPRFAGQDEGARTHCGIGSTERMA